MTLFVHAQFFAYKLWVARDTDDKIGMFVIYVNNRIWRSILF